MLNSALLFLMIGLIAGALGYFGMAAPQALKKGCTRARILAAESQ
jgi:uncharacterized membrane protein YtjA (UPF0391 family)